MKPASPGSLSPAGIRLHVDRAPTSFLEPGCGASSAVCTGHVVVSLAICIGLLAASGCQSEAPSPPAQAQVRKVHGPAECLECHRSESEHYPETGHARSLSRAAGPEFLERFAPQTVELDFDQRSQTLELRQQGGHVFVASPQFPAGLPIEWLFGSGRHAQTPVTVHVNPNSRETESIQFFATWYRETGIHRTLGQGHNLGDDGLATIGLPTDMNGTVSCFRCHVSDMAIDGYVMHMDRVVGGVQCSRCHEDLERHVANSTVLPSSKSKLSPRDSVLACGECHRTGTEPIVFLDRDAPGNTARFAPMGVLKSACFLKQSPDARFDCMTCHDPHRPIVSDPTVYNARCSSCHAVGGLPGGCQPGGAPGSCIDCHMPTIKLEGVISFTEHWIRAPQADGSGTQAEPSVD